MNKSRKSPVSILTKKLKHDLLHDGYPGFARAFNNAVTRKILELHNVHENEVEGISYPSNVADLDDLEKYVVQKKSRP
jgi:hypothetical protein